MLRTLVQKSEIDYNYSYLNNKTWVDEENPRPPLQSRTTSPSYLLLLLAFRENLFKDLDIAQAYHASTSSLSYTV